MQGLLDGVASRIPSHSEIVGMGAVGNGCHLSKVVVGVAVGVHEQYRVSIAGNVPTCRVSESPAAESVGCVVYWCEAALAVSLERRVLEILVCDIGFFYLRLFFSGFVTAIDGHFLHRNSTVATNEWLPPLGKRR